MSKTNDFMLKEDRNLLASRFEKKRLAWEKSRRRGIVFYVFVRMAVLGGLMACWTVLVNFYLYPGKLRGAQFLTLLAIQFAISILVGIWDWHSNERRYRKR